MSKDKQPVEIVVAEFNTEAAASAALKTLKGQLSLNWTLSIFLKR